MTVMQLHSATRRVQRSNNATPILEPRYAGADLGTRPDRRRLGRRITASSRWPGVALARPGLVGTADRCRCVGRRRSAHAAAGWLGVGRIAGCAFRAAGVVFAGRVLRCTVAGRARAWG